MLGSKKKNNKPAALLVEDYTEENLKALEEAEAGEWVEPPMPPDVKIVILTLELNSGEAKRFSTDELEVEDGEDYKEKAVKSLDDKMRRKMADKSKLIKIPSYNGDTATFVKSAVLGWEITTTNLGSYEHCRYSF